MNDGYDYGMFLSESNYIPELSSTAIGTFSNPITVPESHLMPLEKRVIVLEAMLVDMRAKVDHFAKIVTELTEALKASQRGGRVVKYWDET